MMSSDDDIDVTTVPNSDNICSSPTEFLGARSKTSDSKHSKAGSKKSSKHIRKRHSHSSAVQSDEWRIPESPNPYFLGGKKRQNGDKIGPVSMRSKRTCLGSTLLPSDWPNCRKKNGLLCHHASYSDSGLKNQSPLHGNSSATSNSDDFDFRNRFMNHRKLYEKHCRTSLFDADSSSVGCSSSASNDRPQRLQPSENYPISLPSTSRCGQDCIDLDDDNSVNSSRGVRFLDNESDNDRSRSLNAAPLKGGRPFAREYFHRVRKVIGKKVQKILYSDDSSDESEWHLRNRHSVKSSESEDSDISAVPRKKVLSKHTIAHLSSSDSNEDIIPNTNRSPSTNSDGVRNLRSIQSSHLLTPVCSLPSQSRENNPFLAFRNRFCKNKSSRHSLSPHNRSIGNAHRHSGIVRSNLRQLGDRESQHRHLVAQFPDLFNAEDSSELEFFTAHSYSDTETSAESVGGVRSNCANIGPSENQHNSSVVTASSDDEIRIIFDSSGDSVNRRGCSRRSGARLRNSRGSRAARAAAEDLATVSPDPVAQVRQVEEDERYARLLQAEYDAELNEAGTFVSMTDSDESAVVDPVGLDSPIVPFTPLPCSSTTITYHSPPVLLTSRPRSIVQISGGRRRRGQRNIRVPQNPPWMWQFARVLGLGPTHQHHRNHDHNDEDNNDYEALIHLTETVGEVVPRGLLKTEINRLPTRRFLVPGSASTSQACEEVVHKRTELNKECQVCLFDYENGDLLRILPCFHEFHTPCIDPWLKINHTCPVCRVEVVFDS